jgi:hypothetical protein
MVGFEVHIFHQAINTHILKFIYIIQKQIMYLIIFFFSLFNIKILWITNLPIILIGVKL